MRSRNHGAILNILLAAAILLPASAGAQKLTVEDVVAKHVAALGTPEARAAVKSRVAQGTLRYEILNGGAGSLDGKATVVSQDKNVREVLRFESASYRGEDLLTDSSRTQIYKGLQLTGKSAPDRSTIGEFLYVNPGMVRDGIFAGTLATSWPLLSPKYDGAKLKYNGVKKIDGRELHEIEYTPKKGSDAKIDLYFDEDFRHVLTVATQAIEARMLEGDIAPGGVFQGGRDNPQASGGAETANARQQATRYRLEESFGGFRQVDGLTLPTECKVKFSAEGYRTQVVVYDMKFDNIENNVSLDERNFQIK